MQVHSNLVITHNSSKVLMREGKDAKQREGSQGVPIVHNAQL